MESLVADAESHTECDSAIANEFDSEVEGGPDANCACWDALGETYRNENYDCLPEGDDWTINQLYDQQCGKYPSFFLNEFIGPKLSKNFLGDQKN